MSLFQKIASVFSKKSAQFGGLEVLAGLQGGGWGKTKELETYHKSLYVHACVSKIAEKISSIDLDLFQIMNSKGESREVESHPALDLLYRPNAHQTHEDFFKITTINLKMTGDAFWFKVRNNYGKVVELWNMRPDMVGIIQDPELFVKAYRFTKLDGVTITIDPMDVVHFKIPSPMDEYFGLSPVRSAQYRIDTEEYASAFQRDFFLNNARPDAILKTAQKLSAQQKTDIRESFNKQHRGRGANAKIAVFEGGLEYQQVSTTQREMDFIESMKFTRDDILVAFGVPKAIIAITDDVNRANADTSMFIFQSEVIKPTMKMLVEKINEMLIYPEYGDKLYLDFDDPVPENRDAELAEYENGLKNGWLTINEVRKQEDLPPITGGDSIYMPFSNQPIGGTNPMAGGQDAQDEFDQEAKAYKERMARKNLRGKYLTRLKMELKENALIDTKGFKNDLVKSDKPNKSKSKPLITDEFVKSQYVDLVCKSIDRRAENFAKTVNHYAEIQRASLMAKLAVIGDLTKSNQKAFGDQAKAVVNAMYKSDAKVWAEFSLPFLNDFVKQSGMQAMDIVKPDTVYETSQKTMAKLQSRAKQFGLGVNRTTRDSINKAISDGLATGEGVATISDNIAAVYNEFPTWRADMISRTEATVANNEGFLDAYKQSDVVTGKEWVATMDDVTRDEHLAMDGEVVGTDEDFSNGLPFPQEVNCRCVLAPAIAD